MSQELPDDKEQLKQYIEYLLDQNQFLDQELTKSEKEKLELKQKKLPVTPGIDLTQYDSQQEILYRGSDQLQKLTYCSALKDGDS